MAALSTIEKLDNRLARVEVALATMSSTNERIADSLERLVVLEAQHAETRAAQERAFGAIAKTNDRVSAVERELPLLRLSANAVRWAAIGIIAAAAAFVWQAATAERSPQRAAGALPVPGAGP